MAVTSMIVTSMIVTRMIVRGLLGTLWSMLVGVGHRAASVAPVRGLGAPPQREDGANHRQPQEGPPHHAGDVETPAHESMRP